MDNGILTPLGEIPILIEKIPRQRFRFVGVSSFIDIDSELAADIP